MDEQMTQTTQEPTATVNTTPTVDSSTEHTTAATATAVAPVTPQQPVQPESIAAPAPAQEAAPVVQAVPKPEDYTLPEGMPEDIRNFAATHGLSQAQLDASLQQFGGYIQGMDVAHKTALRQMGEAHLKNWGDSANTNLALAKAALRQNDPDGALTKALNESGYGNHPAVLEFLHRIGRSMQEGGFLRGSIQRPPGKKTAAQVLYPEHPSREN